MYIYPLVAKDPKENIPEYNKGVKCCHIMF